MTTPPKAPDANDLARAGLLDDPFDGATAMTDPDEEARALEVAAERVEARTRLDAGRLGALTGPALARMRARRDGTDRPVPLPAKWERTAIELHGGLWAGCWILVGGTGVGKSQWSFEVAYNAAVRHGVPVAYVGLELDSAGLVARLAALGVHGRTAGPSGNPMRVPWSKLYLGDRDALDWFEPQALGAGVLAEMDEAPLYLVTGEARDGWSYRNIGTLARDLREKHPDGPALLVVDFLQLVGGDPASGRREDLRERIGNAAYEGRMAAREHGISVLLLSATARSNYPLLSGAEKKDGGDTSPLGQGDPARLLGTGKESGEVEYSADGVLALCREAWAKGAPPPPVWLAVPKSRAGPGPARGWLSYTFDGTSFEEASTVDRPLPTPPTSKVRV